MTQLEVPMKNTRKVRKAESTRAGRSIMAGLKEIAEAYKSGEPLANRFRVRTVEIMEPGQYDVCSTRSPVTRSGGLIENYT
jgi:hypothetical protein